MVTSCRLIVGRTLADARPPLQPHRSAARGCRGGLRQRASRSPIAGRRAHSNGSARCRVTMQAGNIVQRQRGAWTRLLRATSTWPTTSPAARSPRSLRSSRRPGGAGPPRLGRPRDGPNRRDRVLGRRSPGEQPRPDPGEGAQLGGATAAAPRQHGRRCAPRRTRCRVRATCQRPDPVELRCGGGGLDKLADVFGDLAAGDWTVSAGKQHPAEDPHLPAADESARDGSVAHTELRPVDPARRRVRRSAAQ